MQGVPAHALLQPPGIALQQPLGAAARGSVQLPPESPPAPLPLSPPQLQPQLQQLDDGAPPSQSMPASSATVECTYGGAFEAQASSTSTPLPPQPRPASAEQSQAAAPASTQTPGDAEALRARLVDAEREIATLRVDLAVANERAESLKALVAAKDEIIAAARNQTKEWRKHASEVLQATSSAAAGSGGGKDKEKEKKKK